MKYRPNYPGFFDTIEETRKWVEKFVHWYNHEHLHSGISFVTPYERRYGKDIKIPDARGETYQKAYEANPVRWSKKPKSWARIETVYINPLPEENAKQFAG